MNQENITYKGQVFAPVENDLFRGWEPVKLPEGNPTLAWKGKKIPLDVWYPLSAFMRKFHQHECMAKFYYHAELGWRAWVWPQKYGTGMTISELADHPLRYPQWVAYFGSGWSDAGTLHHHCNAGAFQSGTDSNDEKTQTGLHITLGKMTEQKLDIHTRATFRGTFWEAPLDNWFEKPPVVDQLPSGIQTEVLKHYILACLPSDVTWPKEWEGNLIIDRSAPTAGQYILCGDKRDKPTHPAARHEAFPTFFGAADFGAAVDESLRYEIERRLEHLLVTEDPSELFDKNDVERGIVDPEYARDVTDIAIECQVTVSRVLDVAAEMHYIWIDTLEQEQSRKKDGRRDPRDNRNGL